MRLLHLFCDVDDFCQKVSHWSQSQLLGPVNNPGPKPKLSASEIMTIIIYFHISRYRGFKTYYTRYVCHHLRSEFPDLVSYNRFVELMPMASFRFVSIAGFSASTVTRLLTIWQEEYRGWRKRSLAGKRYVYIWVDGLYFKVRLGDDERIACLVIVGVLPDGRKEVIAIEDGYRESTEAWKTLLRDLKARGMPPPQLAIADGAMGFWRALREVYPQTKGQRCWVHKMVNVLDKLPQRLQGRAKAQLREIMQAPTRQDALSEISRFVVEFEEKYPKATETLTKDQDKLFTYFDYPAGHWVHLRTTNPVESPFATVKQRMKQTRGSGSREAGLAMAFKLLLQAEAKWRRLNAPHLLPLVQTGMKFLDGETKMLADMPVKVEHIEVLEDAAL